MGHKGFKKIQNFVVPYYVLDTFLKIIALKRRKIALSIDLWIRLW